MLIAIDIFFILAMSSNIEWVSLEAKLTITNERLLLDIDTIKALECLKSRFCVRIVTQDNLSKILDWLHETLIIDPSYIYIIISGLYQFLANITQNSAFS